MPDTVFLQSFYKDMAANESFDVDAEYLSPGLVIYNPNPKSIFIWAGKPDAMHPSPSTGRLDGDDAFAGSVFAGITNIEDLPNTAFVDYMKGNIRLHGIELPAGGIWEPFNVPREIHIVYADAVEAWEIRGMI